MILPVMLATLLDLVCLAPKMMHWPTTRLMMVMNKDNTEGI